MGIVNGTKRAVKSLFNLSAWTDSSRLKTQSRNLGAMLKTLFVPQKARYHENFDEALQRQHLTENDIRARMDEFKRIAHILFFVTALIFGYGIYLLIDLSLKGAMVAIAVSGVAFAQAFKFHFWYFQMKKRKLGCTFKEWFNETILRRGA